MRKTITVLTQRTNRTKDMMCIRISREKIIIFNPALDFLIIFRVYKELMLCV
jgi:hypothetical protein